MECEWFRKSKFPMGLPSKVGTADLVGQGRPYTLVEPGECPTSWQGWGASQGERIWAICP